MRKICITAGKVNATAVLNESPTADAVWKALPIEARVNTWGEEIYFAVPVHQSEESGAKAEVDRGNLAYWPPGNAFCIFFGRTPASRGDQIRAASAVNVFGQIEGDAGVFKGIADGTPVRVTSEPE